MDLVEVLKNKQNKRRNTLKIKYQDLLEWAVEYGRRIEEMQRKVITLQEINLKQKDELLEYREKRIRNLKEKR